ncbi:MULTISPECIES: carbohydrate ABC transporter permease [unclassified Saccharopolyspora]|uniref:carbohydrate ABC transporter permease n=3 Tax=Saccharopolyspora TaxID=1835 RepID=UPI001CD616BF|nr:MULTISPECIES: carbohydrate ABC transporter permease [unclassified Saccharopolyspora]MCA1193083.1 carbohydrate ABC transporter permease [Saccharopolyspora sp. 6V]MCA1279083.1 carbohydrate ABC transporter permease [Saccharopolyspora sp. 7B]
MRREPRRVRLLRVAGLGALGAFVVLPLHVVVTTALGSRPGGRDGFSWWPSAVSLDAFRTMWSTVDLARYFANSAVVASASAAVSVLVAVFAAYAVSRFRFRGRELFRAVVLSTQAMPGILFLLPLFLLYASIGRVTGILLQGNLFGLVVTYLTFSLPFSIWLLVGCFDAVPVELDEAALLDGTGPLGALLRVVLPAARPGIAAVVMYAFMTAWGEALFASILTSSGSRTLAVGLREYAAESSVHWNEVMAASLVVSLPVVAGFLLLQRHLVRGVTAGAVR